MMCNVKRPRRDQRGNELSRRRRLQKTERTNANRGQRDNSRRTGDDRAARQSGPWVRVTVRHPFGSVLFFHG